MISNLMKVFVVSALGLALGFTSQVSAQTEVSAEQGMDLLKHLPIQDSGRVKPLDTFARETLQLVYGRTSYRPAPKADGSTDRSRPALEIIMTWFLAPQFWDEQPIVEMKLAALKEALNLEKNARSFYTERAFPK